jgi:hypothetical protein
MSKALTIFIDGVPFDQLHKMPFSRTFASRARLVPILGYSVNCQTELFTGRTPDELGFWCEWEFDPERAPFRRIRWLLPLLALAEHWYLAKRVVHRVLDRLGDASSTKNIPIRELAHFAETGHSVFSDEFDQPSLLDHPGLRKFLHPHFANTPRRDAETVSAAKAYIESSQHPDHVLVTLTRLDHCSHWDGVGSEPYDAMLLENDGQIRELAQAFLAKVPDGTVFVVSDHGMSNIEHTVDLGLERLAGPQRPDRYVYFAEGTILRVWCRNTDVCEKIRSHLDRIEGIEQVPAAERREFGITSARFGDLIYHTHEGYQIVPSYWGPGRSVGMHGHHPRYPGQHGICLSSRAGDFEHEVHAKDFYRVLSKALGAATHPRGRDPR